MKCFVFFNLDECCVHIEVYYETKNEAYDNEYFIYGTYTKLSESVNGRSHYQSDFDDGLYDIYWCGDYNYWMVGYTSKFGLCAGFAVTTEDEKCVHNVGWNWLYADGQGGWFEAGEGLGVRCTGMH